MALISQCKRIQGRGWSLQLEAADRGGQRSREGNSEERAGLAGNHMPEVPAASRKVDHQPDGPTHRDSQGHLSAPFLNKLCNVISKTNKDQRKLLRT